jgi:hypothetical protein
MKKYKPSIDSKLTSLFTSAIPEAREKPAPRLVDWSFLDANSDEPGEPADWVKQQVKRLRKDFGDDMQDTYDEMAHRHRWTRNIQPPAAPPKYDPNEPPFDPSEIFGEFFNDEDEDNDD